MRISCGVGLTYSSAAGGGGGGGAGSAVAATLPLPVLSESSLFSLFSSGGAPPFGLGDFFTFVEDLLEARAAAAGAVPLLGGADVASGNPELGVTIVVEAGDGVEEEESAFPKVMDFSRSNFPGPAD